MRLYHFDTSVDDSIFSTESQSFEALSEARRHAAHLAVQAAGSVCVGREDGGAVVVDAYTAEDGVVVTIRLLLSVDIREPGTT